MRTGQYFRLNYDTLAIDRSGGKPTAVTVPARAILHVTGLHIGHDPRMVEIQWQQRRVLMFAIDLQERGEKLMEAAEY